MFGSKKSEPVKTVATPSPKKNVSYSTTIVTKCTEIKGDIKGCGTIHIDGVIHGDVDVEESVVVGESGIVYGNIKSKSVILSGKLEGSIDCVRLEVMQSGSISDRIDAKEMVADGLLEAVIVVDNSIHITDNGRVETEQMQSKHIVVNGLISGNVIASELLEINRNGKVKGKMIVKKIKVTEGGLMLGTMLTYEDSDAIQTKNYKQEAIEEEDELEDGSYQI